MRFEYNDVNYITVLKQFYPSLAVSQYTDPTNYDSIVSNYNKFLANYIIKKGKLSLSPNEKTFDYFKKNYQKLVGRPFEINSLKPTNTFDKNGKFQEIGRKVLHRF